MCACMYKYIYMYIMYMYIHITHMHASAWVLWEFDKLRQDASATCWSCTGFAVGWRAGEM